VISGRRLALVSTIVAALAAALVTHVLGATPAETAEPVVRPAQAPRMAAPPKSAIRIGRPRPLATGRHETRWAPVRRATIARRGPRKSARRVARVPRRTPEGTENIVLALARTQDSHGRLWVKVRLATLPNGRVGWVPRAALKGYTVVRTRLVIDLRRLTATLTRSGRRVFRARVGVGTRAAPTPRGQFYVRNRVAGFHDPFYGPVAFGTSARSPTLTDWPNGGFVGIHGTDRPSILPGRVSHGCIRMRNADILRLAKLMPVGTPIRIR
jgi:lipoprotein-anchoring transpeptidase ErfK/SrfK